MSVFISDKDMAKLNVQYFSSRKENNSKSNISARMSWSTSEILKPFKNRAGVYYQFETLEAIMHPWSFFKQYITPCILYAECHLYIRTFD